MSIKRLSDVDVAGKRVFIRADLNVPQDDAGNITDDTRIRASVPGIRDALARGAAVMVTSHLGRPTEGQFSAADSMAPVAKRLAELLGKPVPLVRDWVDGGAWHASMKPGDVVRVEVEGIGPLTNPIVDADGGAPAGSPAARLLAGRTA